MTTIKNKKEILHTAVFLDGSNTPLLIGSIMDWCRWKDANPGIAHFTRCVNIESQEYVYLDGTREPIA